jgi:hypothetical protein
MKNILDFIIIGAQKSGTTTLFELLKQHKKIYLPPEKEAPFFGIKDREERGWQWYIEQFFSSANEKLWWGSITPQYMCYPNIASKIYAMNPKIKIIAILRDPYERAFSHFLMSKRRNYDQRNFFEAIKEQCNYNSLTEARKHSTETNSYVIRGEYGRILGEYKKHFTSNNILILFTVDLESNPKKVIDQIFSFLDIEKINPVGLGKKFYQGGSNQKIELLTNIVNKTKQNSILKTVVRNIIPFKQRRRLWHKIDKWNIKTFNEDVDEKEYENFQLSYEYLIQVYNNDAKFFNQEFNITFPWIKNKTKGKSDSL